MKPAHFTQLVLVILDGLGVATPSRGNAVTIASPHFLDQLVAQFPAITLQASGPAVGLPWGEPGNSEVGHLNLGAGRIYPQDLPRITQAIADRSFFRNETLQQIASHLAQTGGALHLVGLFSSGGVHSIDMHFYALLALAAELKIRSVFLHLFTDGRDTPPKVALESLKQLREHIRKFGIGEVASLCGRFYGMDRGGHWPLTEKVYRMIVAGEGEQVSSAEEAVRVAYGKGVSDEMIPPMIVTKQNYPLATLRDGDAMVFVNFRPDRMRQLVEAFSVSDFTHFPRSKHPGNVFFVTMTQYSQDFPLRVAFPPLKIQQGLSEVVAAHALRQLHIAESEKYAHVSVFFNGGRQEPFPGEDQLVVSSPAQYEKNYENTPEMSARDLTDLLIEKLVSGYALIVVNYANADAVGHTGNLQAGIQSIRILDEELQRLVAAALQRDAALIITADHGNIEEMLNLQTGVMDKEHSTNPVPCILIGKPFRRAHGEKGGVGSLEGLAVQVPAGVLSDVAPTVLDLLGIEKPSDMTGVSLLPVLLEP